MLTYYSFANESAIPLKESLAYSLVSFYFSLRWISLAEYFLVLRALPIPCDERQLGPRV
jgi:hypothetical protein